MASLFSPAENKAIQAMVLRWELEDLEAIRATREYVEGNALDNMGSVSNTETRKPSQPQALSSACDPLRDTDEDA